MNSHVSPTGWPALVLNADFRPLSYYPLSLWSWQDTIKAVFLDRVNIVAHYDRAVHSPSLHSNSCEPQSAATVHSRCAHRFAMHARSGRPQSVSKLHARAANSPSPGPQSSI